MQSAFPKWKYYLLGVVLFLGFIYAIPNLYGEDPAVQITGLKGKIIDPALQENINQWLKESALKPKALVLEDEHALLIRFRDPETQLKAKDLLKNRLGENYSVALNLAPVTPYWLRMIGAKPMKLGLDLRGGVHFLMDVDVDFVIHKRIEGYYTELPKALRLANIPYQKLKRFPDDKFVFYFESAARRNEAYALFQKNEHELALVTGEEAGVCNITIKLSQIAIQNIRNETLEQTLATLRNRVNELGVAEAVVQRQGLNRVVVELPGIQDTAYAKDILGKTATLKFLIEDTEHSLQDVLNGLPVIGSKIYTDRHGRPQLFKTQPIITGESITSASASQDRDGRPAVSIRLGGDISLFSKTTRENIGHSMAVIYVEMKDQKTFENAISVATIQSALGSHFQITGLGFQEARDLALLLRSGALPAPTTIVEESIVGPSMGQDNIRMGMISVGTGMGLVLFFMALYYSFFGLIADIALLANLVLLVAIMSIIGATLTLPGIAGIVLTLGMAVDANVLIFERIREEMRLGLSPKASIIRGFEYAFATIVDSNLTTLIVGVVLFAIGTGPVKGFAVTLSIGILTSLFTAITGSRALIEWFYGGRSTRKIRVGI